MALTFGLSLRTVSKTTSELAMILCPWARNKSELTGKITSRVVLWFPQRNSANKKVVYGLPGGAVVENLPANAGTQVRSLLRKDSSGLGTAGPVCRNC